MAMQDSVAYPGEDPFSRFALNLWLININVYKPGSLAPVHHINQLEQEFRQLVSNGPPLVPRGGGRSNGRGRGRGGRSTSETRGGRRGGHGGRGGGMNARGAAVGREGLAVAPGGRKGERRPPARLLLLLRPRLRPPEHGQWTSLMDEQ
eukprot:365208-Chlamydomonas_euryale.AAC.3